MKTRICVLVGLWAAVVVSGSWVVFAYVPAATDTPLGLMVCIAMATVLGAVLVGYDRWVVSAHHREADRTAEAERARLSAIVAGSEDAIFSRGLDGVLTSWNAAAERLFGYSAQEAIGMPFDRLVPEEDRGSAAELFAAVLRGERVEHYETRRLHRDGRVVDVAVSLAPLVGSDGTIEGAATICRDVTEQRRAREALRRSEELFRVAMESAPNGMALLTADEQWLRINPAMCALLGGDHPVRQGKSYRELTHPDDLPAELDQLRALLTGDQDEYRLDKRFVRSDGTALWTNVSVRVVRDRDGAPELLVLQVTDISERKHAERALQHAATHDELTGVANRRGFIAQLETVLGRTRRSGEQVALLFCDLDRFKEINDVLGHDVGDAVLRHVAQQMRAAVRETDVVARIGGDEFVILLNGVTDEQAAALLARKVGEAVQRPMVHQGTTVTVSASVGVSLLDSDADLAAALRGADAAMYRAKRELARSTERMAPSA